MEHNLVNASQPDRLCYFWWAGGCIVGAVRFGQMLYPQEKVYLLSLTSQKFVFPLSTPKPYKQPHQLFKSCILPLWSGFENGVDTVNGDFATVSQ